MASTITRPPKHSNVPKKIKKRHVLRFGLSFIRYKLFMLIVASVFLNILLVHEHHRQPQEAATFPDLSRVYELGTTLQPAGTSPSPATITQQAIQALYQNRHKSLPDVLSHDPKRIPGYLYNDTRTFFGYVMRDLLSRICSRHIAQSHVLVVAPGALKMSRKVVQSNASTEEGLVRAGMNHSVGASTLLHAFRQGHAITGLEPNTSFSNLPSWTLLALIDASYETDAVMVERATQWLLNSTVTYLILGVGVDPNGTSFGREAAETLVNHKYKVQLLSLSHFIQIWGPNLLLELDDPPYDQKTVPASASIDSFFRHLQSKARRMQTPVRGYLFCTQGFDLAIPTASEYLLKVTPGNIEYRTCPISDVTLRFGVDRLEATCKNKIVQQSNITDVWTSQNGSLELSDAACARVFCHNRKVSACATRILPPQLKLAPSVNEPGVTNKEKNNLLLLMLDPMSRERFKRSLPKTSRLLHNLRFASFFNHTAVGNNSGPNQAALYSGRPLGSRDTIATHLQHGSNSTTKQWLWDTLRHEGYATFKSEDGCIANSNMIQSISPKTHHGESLTSMMCYDFQRPNCVGHKSAAKHMIDHSMDFIRHYSGVRPWAAFLHFIDSHEDTMSMEGILDELLWRYLYSFYEQRHETSVWNNTLIIVLSDHGHHYGSYLLSPQGRRDRSQPILHMHLPAGASSAQQRALASNGRLYTTAFDVYRTVLHSLDVATQNGVGLTLLKPLPIRRSDCLTTHEIPSEVCSILSNEEHSGEKVVMPYPPSKLSFYADIPLEQKNSLRTCQETSSIDTLVENKQCICATNLKPWHNCTEEASRSTPLSPLETFQAIDCQGLRSFKIDVKLDQNVLQRCEAKRAISTGETNTLPNILFIEVDSVSFAYADRHFPRTRELLDRYRIQNNNGRYDCPDDLCSAEFPFFSVTGANSIPNQVSAFGGCIVLTGPERCMSTTLQGNNTLCTDHSNLAYGMYLVNNFRFRTQTWCRVGVGGMNRSHWIFDIAKDAGYVTLFAEEFCDIGSEYVTQNNIFPLDADILPHLLFCRETEMIALRKGVQIKGPYWRYSMPHSLDPCLAGEGSYQKVQVSLEHIEKMWNTYSDVPKLAYVNAMAAHSYSEYFRMSNPAEAYDRVLSSFLEGMLKRTDAKNTLIVVRGDHGLQGGPHVADYSTQIEALRPWTEIIVPTQFPNLSISALMQNQDRLATGSDLYRTLAETISLRNKSLLEDPPPWTINLLRGCVPQNRTCTDAKVPVQYCLFESERTITSPNVATCNPQELKQELACPAHTEHFLDHMATEVEQVFVTSRVNSETCPGQIPSRSGNETYSNRWQVLDKIVASFPGSKVSGGIFLYPRQSNLLFSVLQLLSEKVWETEKRELNVCETGFGAGHSAALFLSASNHTKIHTFDFFDRPYQLPALQHLSSEYNGRIVHRAGSSCKTVPKHLTPEQPLHGSEMVQCDFLHGSSLCPSDNIDLVENSPCGAILTSTAMNSITDDAVYFGPKGQWTRLQERGCIRDITCFAEEERTLDRDFVFSRDGSHIAHKFCMAITTGQCINPRKETSDPVRRCGASIARISRHFNVRKFCPHYQQVDDAIKT